MFAYISANQEGLLGVGTLVAMEMLLLAMLWVRTSKEDAPFHMRVRAHTHAEERLLQTKRRWHKQLVPNCSAAGFQRKSAVSIMLESNDKITVRTLVIC